jgi:hypothetical protein
MKLGMMQRVLLAKTKLRDIAAGQLSLLEVSFREAQQHTEARRGEVEVLLQQLETNPPSSGAELLLFDEERQLAKKHVEAAAKVQQLARKDYEQQRKVLQEKARARKTIEKACETVQLQRDKVVHKQEQLQNDEFAVRAKP